MTEAIITTDQIPAYSEPDPKIYEPGNGEPISNVGMRMNFPFSLEDFEALPYYDGRYPKHRIPEFLINSGIINSETGNATIRPEISWKFLQTYGERRFLGIINPDITEKPDQQIVIAAQSITENQRTFSIFVYTLEDWQIAQKRYESIVNVDPDRVEKELDFFRYSAESESTSQA